MTKSRAIDKDFAAKWGTRFHRERAIETPGAKRRTGPPVPDSDDEGGTDIPTPRTPKRRRTARFVLRTQSQSEAEVGQNNEDA